MDAPAGEGGLGRCIRCDKAVPGPSQLCEECEALIPRQTNTESSDAVSLADLGIPALDTSEAQEALASGYAHYEGGIPAFGEPGTWESGRETTYFVVTGECLRFTRHAISLDIPISAIDSVTLQRPALGAELLLDYRAESGQFVVGLSGTSQWWPKAHDDLIVALMRQGVHRLYLDSVPIRHVSDRVRASSDGRLVERRTAAPSLSSVGAGEPEAQSSSIRATPPRWCKYCGAQAQLLPNGQVWCSRCQVTFTVGEPEHSNWLTDPLAAYGPNASPLTVRLQGFFLGLAFGIFGLAGVALLSSNEKRVERVMGAFIGMVVWLAVLYMLGAFDIWLQRYGLNAYDCRQALSQITCNGPWSPR